MCAKRLLALNWKNIDAVSEGLWLKTYFEMLMLEKICCNLDETQFKDKAMWEKITKIIAISVVKDPVQ